MGRRPVLLKHSTATERHWPEEGGGAGPTLPTTGLGLGLRLSTRVDRPTARSRDCSWKSRLRTPTFSACRLGPGDGRRTCEPLPLVPEKRLHVVFGSPEGSVAGDQECPGQCASGKTEGGIGMDTGLLLDSDLGLFPRSAALRNRCLTRLWVWLPLPPARAAGSARPDLGRRPGRSHQRLIQSASEQ